MAPNWRPLAVFSLMLLFSGVKADFSDAFSDLNTACASFHGNLLSCEAMFGFGKGGPHRNLTCDEGFDLFECASKALCMDGTCDLDASVKGLKIITDTVQKGQKETIKKACPHHAPFNMSLLGCGDLRSFRASLGQCQEQVTSVANKTYCDLMGAEKAKINSGQCKVKVKGVYSADCVAQGYCANCDPAVVAVALKMAEYQVKSAIAQGCNGVKPSTEDYPVCHANGNKGHHKGKNNDDDERDNTNDAKTRAGMSPTLKWVLIVCGVLVLLGILVGLVIWCVVAGRKAKGGKAPSEAKGRKSELQKGSKCGGAGPFALAPPSPNDGQGLNPPRAPSKPPRKPSPGATQVQSKAPSKPPRKPSAPHVPTMAHRKLSRNPSPGPAQVQSKGPSKLRRNPSAGGGTSKLAPSKAARARSKRKHSRKSAKASAPLPIPGWP